MRGFLVSLVVFYISFRSRGSCFIRQNVPSLGDNNFYKIPDDTTLRGKNVNWVYGSKRVAQNKIKIKEQKEDLKEELEDMMYGNDRGLKLIREKRAYDRYFSEINNPLLKKISHSNQIKSSSKIKNMAERAKKKDVKYINKINKIIENTIKEERKNELKKVKKKVTKEDKERVYRKTKLTERDVSMLPVKKPGIRALEIDTNKGVEREEIEALIEMGYNGVVDMNTLFLEGEGKGSKTGESVFAKESFEELEIRDKILKETLRINGISRPTKTQKKYLPELVKTIESREKGKNLTTSIVHASTGSGKTLTYMLPILQSVMNEKVPIFKSGRKYDSDLTLKYIKQLLNQDIVVICPSLELCVQSCEVAKSLLKVYELVSSKKEESERDREMEVDELKKIEKERMRVKTKVKPTILISKANLVYQKKNIKSINELKAKDYEENKKAIENVKDLITFSRGEVNTKEKIKRTLGMYFATPGRLYSILFKKKLMDLNNIRFIVMDEYDSYIDNRVKDEKRKVKNKITRHLIEEIFEKWPKLGDSKNKEEVPREYKEEFGNLGKKYSVCVSASNNLSLMPEAMRAQFQEGKIEKEIRENKEKESQDLGKKGGKKSGILDKEYQFPKNILHTVAIYRVPDAKLLLLRKLLKSVPYEKSVLIFCDSNGTANFLFKYLSEKFKSTSVEILNSVQNRLRRKKSFGKVVQTNIDNTNLNEINKKTIRSVKDILVSTRLNSRGIDFSGYTHVINYDLPHDTDAYVHKSGRIGRAGNPGICINLVESRRYPVFKRVIADRLPVEFHKIQVNNGILLTKE